MPTSPYHPRRTFFESLTKRSYSELFLLWLGMNLLFALLYFLLATALPQHAPILLPDMPVWERLYNSFYYSIITGTSTGYGDIVPVGFSKLLAMIQCTLALLVFALLVGKLVSHKQDTTLREVHRMTFQNSFYHLRHTLFIVRKDIDAMIDLLEQGKPLTAREWTTLATAYLQAQGAIEEIPNLYNGHRDDLHSIDLVHEKLLFEAIHRTLERIASLLLQCDRHSIVWMENPESSRELHGLIATIDTIMPLWRDRSPFHEVREFEDIYALSEQLHTSIKSALLRTTNK